LPRHLRSGMRAKQLGSSAGGGFLSSPISQRVEGCCLGDRPAMAVLALPQELLERIIDFLHADRATLCACALAHSTMRAPSQRHLFYQLSLSHGNASARRFGVLLRASSALAAAVQELRLFWTTPGGVHDVLGVTLPALHTLRLDHCWMHQLRATPGFESTRRLVISDAQFEDVGQIVALLGTLPRLSALKFSDSHPGSSVTVVANGRLLSPPSFALTYLDLRGIKQPEIVNHLARWLCAPGSRALTRLETLGTNANQYGDTVTVAPKLLLETVAPTLQELRVVQYHAGLSAWLSVCRWHFVHAHASALQDLLMRTCRHCPFWNAS
jgi:hypothetical protein